jgi:2-C-methyl-D-erythritol 4-phosphate cytidylyltransferase
MKDFGFKLGELLHAFAGTKRPKLAALILAGGSGTRLGSDTPKQHLEILGKSVVCRTLLAFEECPYVDEIVVAARQDDIPLYKELIKKNSLTKIKAVTVGGEDRQESAFKAFLKISDDVKFVAIHDAARCLITPEQITRVAVEAFSCGAAIAACKAKDTVKIVDTYKIKETPDRETVWQAQTPQIIKADVYRACIYTAMEDGYKGTDDASLCERHGFEVRVVDTGYENIKITTPIDLVIAEAIIKQRESEDASK